MYNSVPMDRNQIAVNPDNNLIQIQDKTITNETSTATGKKTPFIMTYYAIEPNSLGDGKVIILIVLLLSFLAVGYLGFAQNQKNEQYQKWLQQINQLEQFGSKQKFRIKIGNIPNKEIQVTPYLRVSMKKLGLYQKIQIGSNFDFGVTQQIDFNKLTQQLADDVKYLILKFQRNQSLEIAPKFLQFKHNKKSEDIEKFLKNLTNGQNQQKIDQDRGYNLALNLIRTPDDEKLIEAEYYLANKNYKIGQQSKQLPMCIFSMQRNILSKKHYQQYFDKIERLNYTNYHVVYIDDFSNDGSLEKIYSQLKNKSSRINNRITLIKNQQKLGALANMFFYIKKFCNEDDIVTIVDADDELIGRQALKILNSVYQNNNTWYVYSKYITTLPDPKYVFKGKQSVELNYTTNQYRSSMKWITSHIRTFRKKLANSVPLYQLIQYHYNRKQSEAWPKFYLFAPDLAFTFPLLELAGNQRIIHINDYLYHYSGPANNDHLCYREHQIYDDIKIRLKIPLQKLQKLNDKAEIRQNFVFDHIKLIQLRKASYNYQLCMQDKFEKSKIS